MLLNEVYHKIDYSQTKQEIKSVLNQLELLNFYRKKSGNVQTFYFDFSFKKNRYTLDHSFLYHGPGVEHRFKFQRPSFFSKKPFYLTNMQLEELSDELMKAVNAYNHPEFYPELV